MQIMKCYTLKNSGLNTTRWWVNIGQNTCWLIFNQQLGYMFNPTFWAVAQLLGLNNPIAGFFHIWTSAGLYLTQYVLECIMLYNHACLVQHNKRRKLYSYKLSKTIHPVELYGISFWRKLICHMVEASQISQMATWTGCVTSPHP